MATKEEETHLWKMVRRISKQIDNFMATAFSDYEGLRPLLGPALAVSALREMQKEGASMDEALSAISQMAQKIEEEPEEKRKGFHIV